MSLSPEEFVKAWQSSADYDEMVEKSGLSKKAISKRARFYRKTGVPLKRLRHKSSVAGQRRSPQAPLRWPTRGAMLSKEQINNIRVVEDRPWSIKLCDQAELAIEALEACRLALPALESAIPWAVGTSMEEQRNNPIIVTVRAVIAKADSA